MTLITMDRRISTRGILSLLTILGCLALMVQYGFYYHHENSSTLIVEYREQTREKHVFPLTAMEVLDETDWLQRDVVCTPQENMAFLKIHKCASSTVQNILMRFGYKHNLLFAMPAKSHIFPLSVPFDSAFVLAGAPFHVNKSNIFTMHTKWNKGEVQKIMFPGTSYFTIVREPTEAFLSLYDYFAFETYYKMTVDEFVRTHEKDAEHFMGCLGYNIMACDMGALPNHYTDPKAIRLLAAQIDSDFDLVMVAERFEESLVLLKHLLCWTYDDLISLNVNSRLKKKDRLTPEITELLRERLSPDYYIYQYFTERFDALVKAFGEVRMARELEVLRRITKEKVTSCNIVKSRPNDADGPETAGASKVDALSTNSTELNCQDIIRPEQAFVGRIKKRQENRLHPKV